MPSSTRSSAQTSIKRVRPFAQQQRWRGCAGEARIQAIVSTDRHDLAQDRTNLAEDRTLLAHERSFAGWMRTGLACVGIGLGFNALFQALSPAWVPKAIASAFLMIAIFVFASAERRACAMRRRLEPHSVVALKPVRIRLLAWALSLAAIALIAAIWWLA